MLIEMIHTLYAKWLTMIFVIAYLLICVSVHFVICVFVCKFRIVTDVTTSTLIVKECSADDEADYEVVIENSAGEISHIFETIVNTEAPKIVQALPEKTDVELHKTAALTVKFESPMASEVTWLANGVTLEDSSKYAITSSLEETTLEIANVLIDDTEMMYTCQVKNVAGQVETITSLTLESMYKYIILVNRL